MKYERKYERKYEMKCERKYKRKKVQKTLAVVLLLVFLLTPMAAAASGDNSSRDVVLMALSQMGYVEGKNEYTKYGVWYGLPNSYWCDMFVSWCASAADISTDIFPHNASCTAHVNTFKAMGCFHDSAVRGGDYIPQQGDLIFFYKPLQYPKGNMAVHVGIVLYVENGYVFSIEGNSAANRLDCIDRFLLDPTVTNPSVPPSYVLVNQYPLDNPRTLGYASPNYADRTPLEGLYGFVDLGAYKDRGNDYIKLHENGIMYATSSHTYSPHHGMTRGDFVASLMKLYKLSGGGTVGTQPFADVDASNSHYDAIMTARILGLLPETEDNQFHPDTYISGADVQEIIDNTLAYLGLPSQKFTFSSGDFTGYGDYTIRADIANALYALMQSKPDTIPLAPTAFTGSITVSGVEQQWDAVEAHDTCFVPMEALRTVFPNLRASESATGFAPAQDAPLLIFRSNLSYNGNSGEAAMFKRDGKLYVSLVDAMRVVGQVVQPVDLYRIDGVSSA